MVMLFLKRIGLAQPRLRFSAQGLANDFYGTASRVFSFGGGEWHDRFARASGAEIPERHHCREDSTAIAGV